MRILFVAMNDSVHTARWISQIADQGWELFLFPVKQKYPHPLLRNITVFGATVRRAANLDRSVRYVRRSSIPFYWDTQDSRVKHSISNSHKEMALWRTIRRIKPDIIHSLEFQHAGYMALHAKKRFGSRFPTWIATNWGSDIYYFGKLAEHLRPIQEILQQCDYYSCECRRDVQLARDMGFRGRIFQVASSAGGMKIEHIRSFRRPGTTSSRKTIVLKGYQGLFGRALIAFKALTLCQEMLQGYTIVVYSADKETSIAAHQFTDETGIPVQVVPRSSHEEILKLFGNSRIHIGLSISDGVPSAMLEAMAMGAFPIQSCTACADEWITDGEGGFIVPPEDPAVIAAAIRRALSDDGLVDRAAEINARTAAQRLDYSAIQAQVIQMYRDVFATRKE